MIKEAIQYLVSLKENKTYEICGETYSDRELVRIPPHVARPARISVTGLDSIVKLVRNELDMFDNLPLFIRVDGARQVSVFTTYDGEMERDNLYEAKCDVPGFRDGFRSTESAIIELRSKFAPGEGTEYLLDLLSRVSMDNGVVTRDNGVSQEVEARSGISLKSMLQVRPRVVLRPYYYTQVCQQMLASGWGFVELLVQIKYITADGDDRKEVRHYGAYEYAEPGADTRP